MYHAMRKTLPVTALCALTGCAPEPAEEPAGLTTAEERQLDVAAERLDSQREEYEAGLSAQAAADGAVIDPNRPAARTDEAQPAE